MNNQTDIDEVKVVRSNDKGEFVLVLKSGKEIVITEQLAMEIVRKVNLLLEKN